jgi:hypothetical protein
MPVKPLTIAQERMISTDDTPNGFIISERLKSAMECPSQQIIFTQSNLRHIIRLACDQPTIDFVHEE